MPCERSSATHHYVTRYDQYDQADNQKEKCRNHEKKPLIRFLIETFELEDVQSTENNDDKCESEERWVHIE
jgi:hypothetical protein